MECFGELKRGRSPGIDRMTVEEYGANLKENLGNLVRKMKIKRYRPRPVKRAYIPKSDGTRRPLGIPTVEDKIVQMGVKKILEAIFEADFVDESYGFLPNRSCHDTLDAVNEAITTKPINYIVDMDIKKFFDTVDHKWLVRCLRQRIVDPSFLRLIARFLKVGVMEEGKYMEVDKGTPQGGIVSPVLANIYLHYALDLWFKKDFTKQLRGYAELVRYADDFIVAFQSEREAKMFSEALRLRLAKFGLKIAEGKSE
jgi:group II intron reverse transcriptase/maturase